MNTLMTTRQQTQWMAGVFATMGVLLTIGGPLILAEHYAQTGARWDASGYYAAEQARRITCQDSGKVPTTVVSVRRGAKNS